MKKLSILLLVFLLADLVLIATQKESLRFYTKTLLIPLLIVLYVGIEKYLKTDKFFVLGLIFSFLGDVFLLFNNGFILGLGSFLIAHCLYIFCFWRMRSIAVKWYYLLAIMGYALCFFVWLLPYLGDLKIPVFVYTSAISAMLFFAIRTHNRWLLLGALSFVVSDSLLAVNQFVYEAVVLQLGVMVTYILAQWLLVLGMLKKERNKPL